jgi:hypothetical protein
MILGFDQIGQQVYGAGGGEVEGAAYMLALISTRDWLLFAMD